MLGLSVPRSLWLRRALLAARRGLLRLNRRTAAGHGLGHERIRFASFALALGAALTASTAAAPPPPPTPLARAAILVETTLFIRATGGRALAGALVLAVALLFAVVSGDVERRSCGQAGSTRAGLRPLPLTRFSARLARALVQWPRRTIALGGH